MKKKMDQVKVLLDALPYIKRFANQIFVIKYGGSAQINPKLKEKYQYPELRVSAYASIRPECLGIARSYRSSRGRGMGGL